MPSWYLDNKIVVFSLYYNIRLYKYTPKVLLLINREYIYIIVNNNITSAE